MSDLENRLLRCFCVAFPELTIEEILSNSSESEGTVDSLSGVTLAALVQEEFDVEIEAEILPQLDSFQAYLTYLSSLNPASRAKEDA